MKTSAVATVFFTLILSIISAHATPPPGWMEDYDKALAKAKAENKSVLLDFTGSDWCGWCIKMNQEVFSQAKFKSFAREKLVLVEVDFPHAKQQTKKVKEQNAKLKTEHGVRGYPTFVLLDGEGKKVWSHVGYHKGGPEAFIEAISGKSSTARN